MSRVRLRDAAEARSLPPVGRRLSCRFSGAAHALPPPPPPPPAGPRTVPTPRLPWPALARRRLPGPLGASSTSARRPQHAAAAWVAAAAVK